MQRDTVSPFDFYHQASHLDAHATGSGSPGRQWEGGAGEARSAAGIAWEAEAIRNLVLAPPNKELE